MTDKIKKDTSDNCAAAKALADEYKAFGKRTAERFRDLAKDEAEDLGAAYRDIGTAYRDEGKATAGDYKKAAKEIAGEYKAFGKHVAKHFREINDNDEK